MMDIEFGNSSLRAVGFYNPLPWPGNPPSDFFGGGVGTGDYGLKPFAVRWMSYDAGGEGSGSGEWQVYLPYGALVVHYGNGSANSRRYAALATGMEPGRDAGGKQVFQWYKIPAPADRHADIQVSDKVYKVWTVYALIKPWARFLVSTDPKANDPVAWAEAIAIIREAQYTDSAGGRRVDHTVIQRMSGELTRTWDNRSAFAVDYILDDETNEDSTYKAQVINQTKMLGRLQESNVDPVDVKSSTEVWLKIAHGGTKFELSVLKTAPSDAKSNDDQTLYKIYDMKDGVVVRDYREDVPELPFYTNGPDEGGDDGQEEDEGEEEGTGSDTGDGDDEYVETGGGSDPGVPVGE